MTRTYAYRDGQRLAPAVAADLDRLAAAFAAEVGETLHVTVGGGLRWRSEQLHLWNGWQRRLPGFNKAAHPDDPKAYHVETNPNGARAVDVHDSGHDPGVTRLGEPEAEWLRRNAHRFNFEPEGYTFEPIEPWHLKWLGPDPWATPDPDPAPTTSSSTHHHEEEEDMLQFIEVAGEAGKRKGGWYAIRRDGDGHRATFIGTPSECRYGDDGRFIVRSQNAANRLEKIAPGLR